MADKKRKAKNKSLRKAKNTKEDEFYTQLYDIEKELKHYREHFKDKVVYFAPEWWCTLPRNCGALYLGISIYILGQQKEAVNRG